MNFIHYLNYISFVFINHIINSSKMQDNKKKSSLIFIENHINELRKSKVYLLCRNKFELK